MSRTRLLMTADTVGGVWQYATDLAEALVPLGYETVLALLGPAPDAAQRARAAAIPGLDLVETGLPLDWLAPDEAAVRHSAAAIAWLATRCGADLIQLNQPALAAEAMPRPTIVVAHSCVATWWAAVEQGPLPAAFAWQTRLVAHGLATAGQVVCPSRSFAAAVAATYRLPGLPAVVANGRAPLPTTPAALHDFVFTAGRLWDRGKNLATLDRAAARLGVPFKMAGPTRGPHGECVVLEHGCAIGTKDETALAHCLSARPVFASAALYEPFGLAVLEAAQAGCPLVLSDIPTFRELWGEVATFVAPDDARGFADAIETLIGDTALRLARGDLARSHARTFTPTAMAEGMAAQYRALAPRKAAA